MGMGQVLEKEWTEYNRQATSEYHHVLARAAARCMQGAPEEDHGDDILTYAEKQTELTTKFETLSAPTFDDDDQFNNASPKRVPTGTNKATNPDQAGTTSSPSNPRNGPGQFQPVPNGTQTTTHAPAFPAAASPGPTASAEKTERVPSLTEADVEQELVEHYKSQQSAQNPLKLMAWDFGGQDVFSTLHPLFLTRYGVYLVVFDMRRLSSDGSEANRSACLSNLRYWLFSIVESTRSATENSAAPIFLVGTHKGAVSDVAEHRRIQ